MVALIDNEAARAGIHRVLPVHFADELAWIDFDRTGQLQDGFKPGYPQAALQQADLYAVQARRPGS